MDEIGLFPLGIVLLPTERVPLHIFEPRYRELIGECLEDDSSSVEEETAARAVGAFRALAALAGADTEPPDQSSPQLSYELAAQVELAAEAKQDLLESRSEQERLELVAELLDVARQTLIATRELGERAKRNGSRMSE